MAFKIIILDILQVIYHIFYKPTEPIHPDLILLLKQEKIEKTEKCEYVKNLHFNIPEWFKKALNINEHHFCLKTSKDNYYWDYCEKFHSETIINGYLLDYLRLRCCIQFESKHISKFYLNFNVSLSKFAPEISLSSLLGPLFIETKKIDDFTLKIKILGCKNMHYNFNFDCINSKNYNFFITFVSKTLKNTEFKCNIAYTSHNCFGDTFET